MPSLFPLTGAAAGPAELAATAGAAALVAALGLALLFRHASRLPQALPNARTLHQRPVCRVGGLSVWAGWLAAMALAGAALPGGGAGWAGWGAIAAISLLDDWRGVPPLPRLGVHLAAAALAAAALPGVTGVAAVAGAALALAWSANLFNFMDGSDGLAATMAVCGFSALAAGAWLGGAPAAPMLALAAACVPLLIVNAPPARMFMGDIGAVPLGFLAALFGLAGWGGGVWPAWFPLLVFLPFIADATATLARRGLARERVWEAHRSHYYQRLHQLGAGHRGTLAFFGVLIAGTGSSAVFALATGASATWAIGGWTIAIAAVFAGIDYHWRIRQPKLR
ncbi:MAG: UDP-phosphate N-acetylglucosaminyl 1-phosphate transferase [Betaproteobacteria bacterium]|nr:UDP-phosphate N-acetylglucosaminyl 1-phosphate transferase [Betaproteobacteria bacterium]